MSEFVTLHDGTPGLDADRSCEYSLFAVVNHVGK